jgi:8-amino-7-oxononanoate synthase
MADIFDKCKPVGERAKSLLEKGVFPYFKPISKLEGKYVSMDGKDLIMMGSNNYLGLTTHPKVREAAMSALKEFGTSCSGSRFLNGTLELHEILEGELADFMNKEAAQVFTTGFVTNQGVIAPIVGRKDSIVLDRGVHASIYDGARLGWGKIRRFLHNDPDSLRKNLERCSQEHGILVVVDGVYSMDGDIAPLPEIIEVCKEFRARLMVDDAHGLGVLGKGGAGALEHFGVTEDVDLVMGTFSKSFASLGGFVAGSEDVISYIRHTSRALIFQASMPPSAVAAVHAALNVIRTEPEIRENLWRNLEFFLEGVRSLGFETGPTETPIVPLIVGEDMKTFVFWKRLFEEGVYTNCIISPAVPEGSQRIRNCLMATHSLEDLEKVLDVVGRVGKELGIIN